MTNKILFYLDDYRIIKAYLYKPFDTLQFWNLKIKNHGLEVNYRLEELSQTNEYYKAIFILENDYQYSDNYVFEIGDKTYPLCFRHIVSKHKFDEDFSVDVHTLGSFYTPTSTQFNVWSPLSNKVRLHLIDDAKYYDMEAKTSGVFSVVVDGDLDENKYRYEITRNGETYEVVDPFAYSSGPNAKYSYVLDLNKFIKDRYIPEYKLESYNDAIIYEMNIRDFTASPATNTKTNSKFISLLEEGSTFEGVATGFDYIKSLGVTHVQLMPVTDYGSVDEIKRDTYNWGYDPMQYNVIEGIYCSNLNHPYTRVNELRMLVNKFHQNNIRVNLDVVFNHVYKYQKYALGLLVPYYPYRYRNDEELSDGSFCGNEIRSEAKFVQDYIVLMCERYLELFDIDGLRFDLMGLTDVNTINRIADAMLLKKPDFMLYGEGWDMPTVLDTKLRSSMNNNHLLERIAFFNPHFRDTVKGPTMMSEIYNPGYVLGNLDMLPKMRDALTAYVLNAYFKYPTQSLNYLECHDNMTFYDKMHLCLKGITRSDMKDRAKLAIAFVLLAQGIPFIHSGQEFMRTKYKSDNTYNLGDYYNQVDYVLRNQNIDVVEFTKDLIKLRKMYPELRLKTREEIMEQVYFEDYYEVLIYNVGRLKIFINPSIYTHKYNLKNTYNLIYNKDQFMNAEIKDVLEIKPLSIAICESKNTLNI